MKLLPEVIPHTLRWYVENYSEELSGKDFQSSEWVYTIHSLTCDLKTKHLVLDTTCCDLGDMGLSSPNEIDLFYGPRLLDSKELIEGVNAERIYPWAYHPSSI